MDRIRTAARNFLLDNTLTYYEKYFDLCYAIRTSRTKRLGIWLIILLLILKSSHFFWLTYYGFRMNHLDHLIHYNVFYFVFGHISPEINLMFATSGCVSALFYYLFYLNADHQTNKLIKQILIERDESFFFVPKYRNQSVSNMLRKLALTFVRHLRFGLLFADIMALLIRFNISFLIVYYHDEFFPSFLIGLCYLSANWTSAILFVFFIYYFLKVYILAISVILIKLLMNHVRIHQINKYLINLTNNFEWERLFEFYLDYSKTLLYFLHIKQMIRHLSAKVMLIMLPLNVHIFFCLFVIPSTKSVKLLAILLFVPQILSLILFIKYYHAMNYKIFRPCNVLPIVMLRIRKLHKSRRIRLSNHLSQWNQFRLYLTYLDVFPLYFVLLALLMIGKLHLENPMNRSSHTAIQSH